jgi:hypothetical protein
MVNGSVSKYYDTSGMYQGRYYKDKKEIRIDMRITEISETTTPNEVIYIIKELFM